MTDDELMSVLDETADAVAAALADVDDWGPSGLRVGQYRADLAANDAALAVLRRAGLGVLSEESGLERTGAPVVVIVDPLDGSTNASRGIPWFATALCAIDAEGPLAALVVNQVSGRRFTAVRGGGAWSEGKRLEPSGCERLESAIIGLNGHPRQHLGWAQSRTMGAAALDLCNVAAGVLDGYVDCAVDAHGVWDYAAAALICNEAGVMCSDAFGRDLFVLDHSARRTPVAGATESLCRVLVSARAAF